MQSRMIETSLRIHDATESITAAPDGGGILGDDTFSTMNTAHETTLETAAHILGYVVGLGSLLLYTPIALRVWRRKSADGLSPVTWWLKLASYTASDIYSFRKGYPMSTFIETVVVAIEVAIVLTLVEYYQTTKSSASMSKFPTVVYDSPSAKLTLQLPNRFTFGIFVYFALAIWGLFIAPDQVVAAGQLGGAAMNSAALIPQLWLNYQSNTKGDYSPLTTAMACFGCIVRLFTITELAGSDPVLLLGFGVSLAFNAALLLQIIYFGTIVEGQTLLSVLASDMCKSSSKVTTSIELPMTMQSKKHTRGGNMAIVAPCKDLKPLYRRSNSVPSRNTAIL
ncbi:MAG: hypothetical protein SGILL_005120 [Bacillariaceae sp.]